MVKKTKSKEVKEKKPVKEETKKKKKIETEVEQKPFETGNPSSDLG